MELRTRGSPSDYWIVPLNGSLEGWSCVGERVAQSSRFQTGLQHLEQHVQEGIWQMSLEEGSLSLLKWVEGVEMEEVRLWIESADGMEIQLVMAVDLTRLPSYDRGESARSQR